MTISQVLRKAERLVAELADPRPTISKAALFAAVRRAEMDRHPVEDMEPYTPAGLPIRPGDLRKRPTFERQAPIK